VRLCLSSTLYYQYGGWGAGALIDRTVERFDGTKEAKPSFRGVEETVTEGNRECILKYSTYCTVLYYST